MADRDDLLTEVAGEIRREARARALRRWAVVFAVGGALAIGGVGLHSLWQSRESERVRAASLSMERARALGDVGALAVLVSEETVYAPLARAHWARALAQEGRAREAALAWDGLASDVSAPASLRAGARVQAARALIGVEPPEIIEARVADLAAESSESPFRHMARETAALAAWRAGDTERARAIVRAARADPDAGDIMRVRYARLAALLGVEPEALNTEAPS